MLMVRRSNLGRGLHGRNGSDALTLIRGRSARGWRMNHPSIFGRGRNTHPEIKDQLKVCDTNHPSVTAAEMLNLPHELLVVDGVGIRNYRLPDSQVGYA
jgi:hypothetical protein